MSGETYKMVIVSARMEDLERIAEAVISRRLAACAQVLPGIMSYFHWKGNVEKEQEGFIIFKTAERNIDSLFEYVRSIHPYEVPEILSYPIENGIKEYLDWISAETKSE